MFTTDEFFSYSSTINDSTYIQLIDSNNGEIVNFKKVSIWIDETFLIPNDPRVLSDEIIYRSRKDSYYVNTVVFSSKKVYITSFGVNSSYGIDQRESIQKAFNICSLIGLKLVFPNGHYIVNSYSADPIIRSHGGILELKSYLDVEFEEYSIIKVGTFFDDKPFILFSGLNAYKIENFISLCFITFSGKGIIDFNGDLSQMRQEYVRRIGFDPGKCIDVEISGLYWMNGDLSNCISVGWNNYGKNVSIHDCYFENLATGNKLFNTDHSTIYGNVDYLNVYNNIFIGNKLMSLIGCACELHGAYSSFTNNKIFDYLRMNFVALVHSVELSDRLFISNINISDNIAEITSSAIYFWSDEDRLISNVLVNNNNIKHRHISDEGLSYNGWQCLFVILNKKGKTANIIAKNNFCHILFTIGEYSRYACHISSDVTNLEISNNHFLGHSLGISFDADPNECDFLSTFNYIIINANNFSSSKKMININALSLSHCMITENSTYLDTNDLENIIEINSDLIISTMIKDNNYTSNYPKIEFTPSAVFKNEISNKAKYILSNISTPVPLINDNDSSFIIPVISSNHKRVGGMYTIQPSYPFNELFFHPITFAKGGTADVSFKVDNITSLVFYGNNNLLSNIIVDM